jgi:hypothetical protein
MAYSRVVDEGVAYRVIGLMRHRRAIKKAELLSSAFLSCFWFFALLLIGRLAEQEESRKNQYYKESLQANDVGSLWAFLTLSNGEFNFLTFGQSFEAVTNDRAEMCEYVRAVFLLNEAEAFAFVKPFYCAGNSRHCSFLF